MSSVYFSCVSRVTRSAARVQGQASPTVSRADSSAGTANACARVLLAHIQDMAVAGSASSKAPPIPEFPDSDDILQYFSFRTVTAPNEVHDVGQEIKTRR